MRPPFEEMLSKLIDAYSDESADELISALEIQLMALKEQQAEAS